MINVKQQKGFTLIETLVVFSIMTIITVSLLNTVFRSRLNINESARIIMADIRTAQANSLATKQYNSQYRCGYGIHLDPADNTKYFVFVGRAPNPTGCPVGQWSYNKPDTPVFYSKVLDSRLEFFDPTNPLNKVPNNYDIAFEPYNAKIWIANWDSTLNQNQNLSQIGIRKKGVMSCSSKTCAYICVYSFGRIAIRTDQQCPLCDGPYDADPATCQQWN